MMDMSASLSTASPASDTARHGAAPAAAPPVSEIIGLAQLARAAFRGESLQPLIDALIGRVSRDPQDHAAWIDLSLIEMLSGNRDSALQMQAAALNGRRLYRRAPRGENPSLRILALVSPGDFMMNTPIDFLLADQNVDLHYLYVTAEDRADIRPVVAQFDVVFAAVAEHDANRPILEHLDRMLGDDVLNRPARTMRLTRDGAWSLLHRTPGVLYPRNARVARASVEAVARDGADAGILIEGAAFPLIIRPVGSHAGAGLYKADGPEGLAPALAETASADFYVAPFVDYRNGDGLYRKYRIAVVDGVGFPVHLAISTHWMVHYLNADMIENPVNRAEEAEFMANFAEGFGARHQGAFAAIARTTGLDYFQLDCSEAADGSLLIFEIGTAMIVHSMDPPEIFPYKAQAMQAIFSAFAQMVGRRAA